MQLYVVQFICQSDLTHRKKTQKYNVYWLLALSQMRPSLTDIMILLELFVVVVVVFFFASSTDNLGNLLREDPTTRGLIYLCGCFLPLMSLWTFKMYFDARYIVQGNDVFHQCFDMAALLALATAALHIRSVAILSNPVDNVDMFAFAISVCLAEFLCLGRLLEIAICQGCFQTKGLYPEAFFAVRREALYAIPTVLLYVTAVIYLGIQHFSHHGGGGETAGASQPGDEYAKDGNASLSSTSHRSLASGETPSYSDSTENQDDVAIWLLLVGFAIGHFTMLLGVLCFQTDHKKYVFLQQQQTRPSL